MVRTDLPFKKFFSLAVIIPYMIPSWCKSQAWLTMFKTERIGGAPGFLTSLGVNVPEWLAYGPVAIILVLSLHYYAYAYLLVSAEMCIRDRLNRSMGLHFPDDSRLPSDQPLGGQNADILSALGWLCRLSQLGDLSAQSIRQRFCKI